MMLLTPKWIRIAMLVGLGLVSVSGLSCSGTEGGEENRVPVFPVSGKVLVNGQPADNALVIFHPVAPAPSDALRPNGRTDSDGNFTLTTYENSDGAPPGNYVVTVIWPEPPAGPMPDPDLAPDRLRGRYANPKTSLLKVQVTERENALAPFQLKKAR